MNKKIIDEMKKPFYPKVKKETTFLEILDQYKKYFESDEEKLRDQIENFKEQLYNLKKRHENPMLIYSLCKIIAKIGILNKFDFARLTLEEKIKFVSQFVKYENFDLLHEGVLEFHENCDHYKL